MLIKETDSGSDFYLGLLNFRACPRDGLSSLAELLMGRKLNTRLPTHDQLLRPHHDNIADYQTILRKQAQNKGYYDQHTRALPELKPGQRVVLVDEGKRKHAKVQCAAPQPRSYFVEDTPERRYRRNRRHLLSMPPIDGGSTSKEEDKWSNAESDSQITPDEACNAATISAEPLTVYL